ncbi:MAG: hypothetical protein QM704_12675 [Anaeromyxobacteraceae bacterium]
MYRTWLVAIAFTLATAACSSSEKKSTPQAPPTQAELAADIAAANPADTDGDGLPDEVEKRYQPVLGTDWQKADTDGDGVNDGVEVLGDAWLWVVTKGQAGALPGPALAGNANNPASASVADSDGDGVPDYLEVFGYDYDVEAGRFVAKAAGFHTDPLQWSTDQDAYSDGQEVSGVNMDVAVREPGTHPLVPAYPDIQVELTGYAITLNGDIQYTDGGSLSRESNWSREVEQSHSLAEEVGLEVKVGASLSGKDLGFSGEVTASVKVTNTDTTTTSHASGGSVIDESNWSRAVSTNPTEAAAMKLLVKVYNRGTAPASNVIPTLSLRVGGADVATFEPPDLSVANLLPGAAFPPDAGVSWVIDSVTSDRKLYLTDWELRALESRAPVALGLAQKRADVMRLEDGKWTSVGDAGEYLARIVSTSADILADVGTGPEGIEGNLIHARVAANDSATSPAVTLGEALAWTMKFRQDGDHYAVDHVGDDGVSRTVPLSGRLSDEGELLDDGSWRWQFDELTLALNGHLDPATLDFAQILALRLHPGSRIGLRAPRANHEATPSIYTAWGTSSGSEAHVVTCASDYDGIAAVAFVAADGTTTLLAQDGRGPYFYSGEVPGPLVGNGTEKVRVTSTRKLAGTSTPATAERPIRVSYAYAPKPAVVENMILETSGATVTRLYVSAWSPTSTISNVWVFNGNTQVATLTRVANYFEDAHGYDNKTTFAFNAALRLVIETADKLYTVKSLSEFPDFTPYKAGELALTADFDWTGTPEWWVRFLDLDYSQSEFRGGTWYTESGWYGTPQTLLDLYRSGVPAPALPDLYLLNPSCTPYLGFFQRAMPAPGYGDAYYSGANRRTIVDAMTGATNGWIASGQKAVAEWVPGVQSVFFFETPDGRLGKLLVTAMGGDRTGWPYENCWNGVRFSFAIYAKP